MPIMVLYKDKQIPMQAAEAVIDEVAVVTQELLRAKIEVRVIEPVYGFNANEIHIEMRFRDFGDWTDELLKTYHATVMKRSGMALSKQKVSCTYSFYIIPSTPPRSMWAQIKLGAEE